MDEFLRNFVMKTIKGMIDNGKPFYYVSRYALNWFKDGTLLQEDLKEIERLYEEKEKKVENSVIEEPIEEIPQNDEEMDTNNIEENTQDESEVVE